MLYVCQIICKQEICPVIFLQILTTFLLLNFGNKNLIQGIMKASGTFSVKMNPLDGYTKGVNNIQLNRMSIDKSFSGDIKATSKGEMLSAMTPVKGSAGYVAIEQVDGEVNGKKGSFVLQHFGTMSSGSERLILEVVPDSGTDDLTGISGSMSITIEDGEHFYEFDYGQDK